MSATQSLQSDISCCIWKICSPGEFWISLNLDLTPNTLRDFISELNEYVDECIELRGVRLSYDAVLPEIGELLGVKVNESTWRPAVCTGSFNDSKGIGPEIVYLDCGGVARISLFDYETLDGQVVINSLIKHFFLYNVIPVNNKSRPPWAIETYGLIKDLVRLAKEIFVVPVWEDRKCGIGRMFGFLYLNIMGDMKDVRQILLEEEFCIEDELAFCELHGIDEDVRKEVTPLPPCLITKSMVSKSRSSSAPGRSTVSTSVSSPSSSSKQTATENKKIYETKEEPTKDISESEILSKWKFWGQDPLTANEKKWILQKSKEEANIYFSKGSPRTEESEIAKLQEKSEESPSETSLLPFDVRATTKSTIELIKIMKHKLNIRPNLDLASWLKQINVKGCDVSIGLTPWFLFLSPSDWVSVELCANEASSNQAKEVTEDCVPFGGVLRKPSKFPSNSKVPRHKHGSLVSAKSCGRGTFIGNETGTRLARESTERCVNEASSSQAQEVTEDCVPFGGVLRKPSKFPSNSKVPRHKHGSLINAESCGRGTFAKDKTGTRLEKQRSVNFQNDTDQENCMSTTPNHRSKLVTALLRSLDFNEKSETQCHENVLNCGGNVCNTSPDSSPAVPKGKEKLTEALLKSFDYS